MNGWVVVLAAGSSRRLGRAKARLPWGPRDEPLLSRIVREACAVPGIAGIVAVVPPHDPTLGDLARAVDEARVQVVVNEAAESGMASSIDVGVRRARTGGADFVVLVAVDQPLVGAREIEALVQALRSGAPAAAAVYAGIVGIPAAFTRASFDALSALEGDRGARGLLRDDPVPGLVQIAMESAAVDVDTEAAYQAARSHVPDGEEPTAG